MEVNICKKCGSVKDPTDGNGNPGPFCPNECEYDSTDVPFEPINDEEMEAMAEACHKWAYPKEEKTTCWVCGTGIDRSICAPDHPYGHHCPNCGASLRFHPKYGVGNSKDLGKCISLNIG